MCQVFGNNPFEATIAQSSYNSLQASVRHTGNYSTFLFGYTYSKCMDDASELIEGINPFNPKLSTSLCAFDVKHNFVASYETKIPFDRFFHTTEGWKNKLASGWAISGITSFASGLPVSLSYPNDNSFTGTAGTSAPIDLPDFTPGGPILQNTNPRKGGTYFNTALFSDEPLGQIGNSKRRFLLRPRTQQLGHGPAEGHKAYRIEDAPIPFRSVQYLESRPIFRSAITGFRRIRFQRLWSHFRCLRSPRPSSGPEVPFLGKC